MGHLINGKWEQADIRQGKDNAKGEFIRKPMSFRNSIEEGGKFTPESDRYHLYVSYACPWAHRSLIMRSLKGLESHIDISVVSPYMLEDGWSFLKDFDELPEDKINGKTFLREVYLEADPHFTGRVTVPVLWDKKEKTIVNNESSEIIRIFNSAFNELTGNDENYYPQELQPQIDHWNEKIYSNVNNGVYRCGFARSQQAYESAFKQLFSTLDELDQHLQKHKFLCGDDFTEADIRLFPTLFRFDAVYHTHFKCNGKLIAQYPGLNRYLKQLLANIKIARTTNMEHVKAHYYYSHVDINPSRIIAAGPLKD